MRRSVQKRGSTAKEDARVCREDAATNDAERRLKQSFVKARGCAEEGLTMVDTFFDPGNESRSVVFHQLLNGRSELVPQVHPRVIAHG